MNPSASIALRSKSRACRASAVPPGKSACDRTVGSSYADGIGASRPVRRSNKAQSTAQPRLWREPFAGSATYSRCDGGTHSQNRRVTDHGRYASNTTIPYPCRASRSCARPNAIAAGRWRKAMGRAYTGRPTKLLDVA